MLVEEKRTCYTNLCKTCAKCTECAAPWRTRAWQWCEDTLPEFPETCAQHVQVSTNIVQCAKSWTTHVQWQWCDDALPEFYYERQASFCAQLLNFNWGRCACRRITITLSSKVVSTPETNVLSFSPKHHQSLIRGKRRWTHQFRCRPTRSTRWSRSSSPSCSCS